MSVQPHSLCRLVTSGGIRYIIVHVNHSALVSSWGVWQRNLQGKYQLVLGPLDGYMPLDVGLVRIGITEWETLDSEFATPADLPTSEYVLANLGSYPKPKGVRKMTVAARKPFPASILHRLRLRRQWRQG